MHSQFNLKRLDHVTGIPTIPSTLLKVNEMLRNEECSVKTLCEIIESDQALTAKILRLVNSAFYGFRSRIVDVRQALMILGFNTVRNAIVTISVIDTLKVNGVCEGFDIKDLWKHSIAVAITGRHLAERSRIAHPADVFVAGLLHDIGKIIIAQFFGDHFSRICKSMREKKISFSEAEKNVSPGFHGDVGGYVAEKWQFPPRLTDAIRFHHDMSMNADDPWLLVSVYLANIIVNDKNFKFPVDCELFPRFPEFSAAVASCLDNHSEWFPETEIEDACEYFLGNGEK